jgi:hypothetical protein
MANIPTLGSDILSGLKDTGPMWLETADRRESAYERMPAIALKKPGSYSVFCAATSSIIYAVDKTVMN